MKVQIIKCSGKEFWYANKIGQIFDVDIFDFMHYRVIGDSTLLILKTDTIPVEKIQQLDTYNLKMKLIHYLSKKKVIVKSFEIINEDDSKQQMEYVIVIIQKTKKKKHG